ncbi:unnamed protein product [Heligmosomoides polygyrus]|uniref:Clathrin light chain n=1 Tax=Heligmosomoides polygyrus TaxID=6339 RepID=A0A183G5B5_HELPZ|nr:unnamed protein product [Heligmosomoides polygyrus]
MRADTRLVNFLGISFVHYTLTIRHLLDRPDNMATYEDNNQLRELWAALDHEKLMDHFTWITSPHLASEEQDPSLAAPDPLVPQYFLSQSPPLQAVSLTLLHDRVLHLIYLRFCLSALFLCLLLDPSAPPPSSPTLLVSELDVPKPEPADTATPTPATTDDPDSIAADVLSNLLSNVANPPFDDAVDSLFSPKVGEVSPIHEKEAGRKAAEGVANASEATVAPLISS